MIGQKIFSNSLFLLQFTASAFTIPFQRPGGQYPSLRRKQGGISQSGSTSYLFQRVKLPMFTKFHVSITIYSKRIHDSILEAWGPVPQSKNRTSGHFFRVGLHLIFFSVSNCLNSPSFNFLSQFTLSVFKIPF